MRSQPIIGVLTPNIGGNYYSDLIYSLQQNAAQIGAKMIFIATGGKYFDVPIAMDYVDGWIVINCAVEEHFLQRLVKVYNKPIVTIGKDIRPLKLNGGMIMTNNQQAIEQMVKHLYEHGHRHIGFLGSLSMDDMQQRFRGYLSVMHKLGLEVKSDYIYDCGDMTILGGRQAAEKIIENQAPISAIVCCTDMSAHGMAEKFLERGYKIPEDFAVVGFDNSATARFSPVPLSSVDQDISRIGRAAFDDIIERIKQHKPFTMEVIECKVVKRQSCGCEANFTEMMKEEKEDYELQAQRLKNEQNINHEVNRYMVRNQLKRLRELGWLLESYFDWGCISKHLGYNNQKEPKLKLTEFYNFVHKQNYLDEINMKQYESLQSYPPIHTAFQDSSENEVIYVIPYRLTHNNWSLMSFGTSHRKTSLQTSEHMKIVYLFDIISTAFDRIALIEEAQKLNARHQNMTEKYNIINNLSQDIFFEIDFEKKQIWTNRSIKFKSKNSTLLGLEEYIHPNDISDLKKHFYEHFRDNKPFFIQLRVLSPHTGNYYSAYVSAESTRDKYGNIQKLVGTIRDVMSSQKMNQDDTAPLGIISRRDFYSKIKQTILDGPEKFALLVIDIDNFKIINDTYGHQVGDYIIDLLIQVLTTSINDNDRISRFGGDEFIVIFQYDKYEQVEAFASHILSTITNKVMELNKAINLSVSIGLSLYPEDGTDYEDLLKKSDLALFYMKSNGKSNYQRFEPSMLQLQQDKRKMEKLLRDALTDDRFMLLFQPQVDSSTKKVYGVEVLLRLKTENGVIITPDKFIPVAESLGLIQPIGEWVLRAACKQAIEWLKRGYMPIKISVNISGHQLKSVQFIPMVKRVLEETGMNPAHLIFEITETTILDQSETVMTAIEEIRKLGISIAIDDFGISYSSLSVLKNFPIDILKIDKSFVSELTTDDKGYKIVHAIIHIAKSLDMKIVAEGVETIEQLQVLDELDCHYCQGYYISKPVNEVGINCFLPSHPQAVKVIDMNTY